MTEKQTTEAAAFTRLPRAPWRLRHWRVEDTPVKIAHRHGRVPVPHHRLVPVDPSRYTAENLPGIRRTHR